MSESLPADTIRARSLPYMTDIWNHLGDFPEAIGEDLPDSIRTSNARSLLQQAIKAHTKDNPRVTARIYPELNHLFLPARTGHPTEYPMLKGNFSPQVLQDMAEWLKDNL